MIVYQTSCHTQITTSQLTCTGLYTTVYALNLALRNPFQSSPWQHSSIRVSQAWSHVT
jgi:hypothetical protein